MEKIRVFSFKGRRGAPGWVKAVVALMLAGVLAFGGLFGLVMAGSYDHITGEPDIMIILGCQVKPWGPSILLQDRLDEALDYLEDHPDMTVVVSGGQGPDEHISEAQAMADYLIENGIDGDNILLEDQSHNTVENLRRTRDLLLREGCDLQGEFLLVSNGFHLTRARMLWDRVWTEGSTLSTLAAPSSHVPSRLKMYIREPLALVKSFVFDK